MQKRASRLSFKELCSFLLVAVLTVLVITVLSSITRLSNLADTEAVTVTETHQTSMSAVIPEDNSNKVVTVTLSVFILLTLPIGIVFLMKWVRSKEKTARKTRRNSTNTEVTFKTISKREIGRKRITRPERTYY